MSALLALFLITFGSSVLAESKAPVRQGYSEAQLKMMAAHNLGVTKARFSNPLTMLGFRSQTQRLPYAEYEEAGYLVFSDDDYRGLALEMKQDLAKNLPAGVVLVVFTGSTDSAYQQRLKARYTRYLPSSRVKIVQVRNPGHYFWARDGLPVPVWNQAGQGRQLAMVDARYYHNFNGDIDISRRFGAKLISFPYYFEGGNFVANRRGDCLTVNRVRPPSITGNIPDEAFMESYGCRRLIRLPKLKGIGHADEVVKFINDDLVITDTREYVQELKDAGFEVRLLPEADLNYETYINSLQVNNTMYVPIFGERHDKGVIQTYEAMGFDVVTIPTRPLAIRGQGGIHCITMTYPPVPFRSLLRQVSGKLVQ